MRMQSQRGCTPYGLLFLLLLLQVMQHSVAFLVGTPISPVAPRHGAAFCLYAASSNNDARGAALLLEDVTVYRGPSRILHNVDWRIEPRTKWALVGQNGAGKSTLLKAIVGEIAFDGSIRRGTKGAVGYLQQTAVAGSSRTVYEEAASGMVAINDARHAVERASANGDLEALEKATSRFEAIEGYKQEQKVSAVLKGLGFTNFDKKCDELSGGWQMRVAFARLLLSEPSLCLMDEPGNHLDAAAKNWLAKYLADYDGEGSMILVTHDVGLLKSMDHIAEVVPPSGNLQIYKSCRFDQYLDLKEQRAAVALSEYDRNAEKAAKLQAFVDRFGASATKASAAQSRVKQIQRMEREGLLDAPSQSILGQRFRPSLVLPNPPKAVGEVLLSLSKAAVGYKGKSLVSGIDLDITKGMKLLIRGPNGAGKSTVLHSLRGHLPLLQGTATANPNLRLGMFTQDLAQELDPEARAVDMVTAYAREGRDGDITVSEQGARAAMGRLGLQGEKALRRIRDLSGGEKARVALAMFSIKPSHVYLFDEVSNHLDRECVEALSVALSEWGALDGAIVVVSHDQTFCRRIDFTHVATVKKGCFKIEQRNALDDDWEIEGLSDSNDVQVSGRTGGSGESPLKDFDKDLRKRAFNAPKRIAKLQGLIESAEEKIAALETKMMSSGSDVGILTDLSKQKDVIERQVQGYIQEWEDLEVLVTNFQT